MLSLRSRVVALAATGALAALLALPAFAQALWIDTLDVDSSGATVYVLVEAEASTSEQTIALAYDSTGPNVTGPATVSVPAGDSSVLVPVEVGEGYSGDAVYVGSDGPSTEGATYVYLW